MKLAALTSSARLDGAEEAAYVGTRVMAVAYFALAPFHILVLTGAAQWVMATAALLTAVASVLMARWLASADSATIYRWVWFVCAVPLCNSLLHVAVTGDIGATDMVMLCIVGTGAVAPERRGGLALTFLSLAIWGVVVATGGPYPEGAVLKYAINLGLASLLAYAVFGIRSLTNVRLRLAEAKLTDQLRDLNEARGQLEAASTHDPLTGCFNRRGWDDRVAALHRLARREGASLTVGIIDLDHFKQFNDTLGHQAGDELLTSFARHASEAIRDVDVLARWGGDEFTVALYGCSLDEAAAIFRRIGHVANDAATTCSIGFAQAHPDESTDGALSRADHALYRAKRGGRAQAVHCACQIGAKDCREGGRVTAAV